MAKMDNKLQQILDIGIALTAQKDPDKLLGLIIDTAMDLTGSDGGTLYRVTEDSLVFRIMKTRSKGIDRGSSGETIDIPPVPIKKENICAYAALTKQSLNIPNVYESDLFDFSGPKKYDEMNAYHTQSMIALPMINASDEVIGVMQLINAMDDDGIIRPYTKEEEQILLSLASQTAISLANMSYVDELNKQMWSFTEAMTEAIDARTPYNGNHTRKVAEYAGMLVDDINARFKAGTEDICFTKEHKDQIVMAAYLHDIGKMIVPIEVMNKETRLVEKLEQIQSRIENISLRLQIDLLKGQISKEECETQLAKIVETCKITEQANSVGFLNDELYEQVKSLFAYEYKSPDGEMVIPFLTEEEKMCLQIRKGTLTDEERQIMESHVVMTERILNKVHFNKAFCKAPLWAAQHHEAINGKGYPKKLSGDELGIEARILAVADICDALLATDRPYKKPLPKEKAFSIMEDMAAGGMIDGKLVGYLKECI